MKGLRRVLTPAEQSLLDRTFCTETKLSSLVLMEAAANALYCELSKLAPKGANVLLLLGCGNNAGDGWALGRLLLAEGYRVYFLEVFPGRSLSSDAKANKEAALVLGAEVFDFEAIQDITFSVVVDAVFGSGFRATRPFSEALGVIGTWLEKQRRSGAIVLAVDLPSGLDGTTGEADEKAFRADRTVTFLKEKLGLVTSRGRDLAGKVSLAAIGMPEDFQEKKLPPACYFVPEADFLRHYLPQKKSLDYKGSRLKLQLTGGSEGMVGALILAARAALKAGATYTYAAVADGELDLVLKVVPELLLSPLSTVDWDERLNLVPVHVVGPGLGLALSNRILEALLLKAQALVLDADALNHLSGMPNAYALLLERQKRKMAPAILTPHYGEFLRLFPEESLNVPHLAAQNAAKKSGSIIVLKGHATIIAEPSGRLVFNNTGNAGLGKAGSGDLLSGILGAILTTGLASFEAAVTAVNLHGALGDRAAVNDPSLNFPIVDILDELAPLYQAFTSELDFANIKGK